MTKEMKGTPRIPLFRDESDENILSGLGALTNYTGVNVEMGKLFITLWTELKNADDFLAEVSPTVRRFNGGIANLELAGLIIVNRTPNAEPQVRLTTPGIDAARRLKK